MEVLTTEQREFFDANGYLVLENRIPMDIIKAIRAEISAFEEISRSMTAPDDRIDLEPTHTPEEPRLRRIKLPHTQSEVMRDLMYSDHVLAPARDLIGPDLRIHTTKLNMKVGGGGAAVEWHQDFAFYPHTNDDGLAIGVLIDDMETENGPLMVFPGSHKGPIYDHHQDDIFVGAMDLAACGLDMADAVELKGPAGSISLHHGRIVHGSALNVSDHARRILFYEMLAADAFPIMGSMTNWAGIEDYDERMLCGKPTLKPRLKHVPVRIPQPQPDKRGSIYEIQDGLTTKNFETLEKAES
ncbi:MAG: phytanoyl-CoA dioxygenase family protein [Pseudomonadota bacterium]